MSKKPSIPRGTRDFSPDVVVKRQFIYDRIRETFELFGYSPIGTPAMENLDTLMGKYGEEGDRLLFKILNSGDFLSGMNRESLLSGEIRDLSLQICEKGLRYDLTVPFARYVVRNQNDLVFPFRRYQMGPVWRADKPQKGRYREFFQCDADIIGSNSMLNEVEFIGIIDEVFRRLGIPVQTRINNRKILAGITEFMNEPNRFTEITIAIDKIDKIGTEKSLDELIARGLSKASVEKLGEIIRIGGTPENQLNELKKILKDSKTGMAGVEELENLFGLINGGGTFGEIPVLDLKLARGLDYYTGTIIEVLARDMNIGSICGGGRYDDLTGVFGLKGVSGMGISFGADRIYDVMEKMDLFPPGISNITRVLFVNFGADEERYILPILKEIRSAGIRTELYPDRQKIKKQLNYANQRGIPFVAMVGENEMRDGFITLKDMETGEQRRLTNDQFIDLFSQQE